MKFPTLIRKHINPYVYGTCTCIIETYSSTYKGRAIRDAEGLCPCRPGNSVYN